MNYAIFLLFFVGVALNAIPRKAQHPSEEFKLHACAVHRSIRKNYNTQGLVWLRMLKSELMLLNLAAHGKSFEPDEMWVILDDVQIEDRQTLSKHPVHEKFVIEDVLKRQKAFYESLKKDIEAHDDGSPSLGGLRILKTWLLRYSYIEFNYEKKFF